MGGFGLDSSHPFRFDTGMLSEKQVQLGSMLLNMAHIIQQQLSVTDLSLAPWEFTNLERCDPIRTIGGFSFLGSCLAKGAFLNPRNPIL